jgi:CubicO group peptidase (beta-lactamase class C family)
MIRTILASFVLAATSAMAHASDDAAAMMARIESPQADGANELDALDLPALMQRLHVPGFSIAVVKDFKVHWAKAYGVADDDSRQALTTETRFQSASIAKPVSALAAMRLVQDGRLSLDADVNTLLKSWRVPAKGITPRALFSHTSGADDGFGFPGYEPGAPLPSIAQILDGQPPSNVGRVTFARPPFATYKYSGGGVLIMQQALMDMTGTPFASYMQSRVLAPLQMSHSTFGHMPLTANAPPVALAHGEDGRRMGAPWHVYPELATSNLWSTPTDIAKFVIEIQSALRGPKGKLLEQRVANEMLTPAGVGGFAIGLGIGQRGQGWYFFHSGANWGYRAWMIGHMRKGYGLVMMTNSENGMALLNQLGDRVERAYSWDSLVPK